MQRQYEQKKTATPLEEMFGKQMEMKNYDGEAKDSSRLGQGLNEVVNSYMQTQKTLAESGIKDPYLIGQINKAIGGIYLAMAKELGKDGKYSLPATMYGMLGMLYLQTASQCGKQMPQQGKQQQYAKPPQRQENYKLAA